MNCPEQVAADPEEILDDAVHRGKPLQMGGRIEPAHLSLALPSRLVGDFGAVVPVLVRAVNHRRHHGAERRRVAAQLVRDQPPRFPALAFQQLTEEPLRRAAIASRLDEDVDYVPVLVDGPPQVLLPALNPHEQLTKIPRVTLPATPAPQPSSVLEPEGQAAGWPREITLPGLPQIRTCPIRASGSSVYGLAARRYVLWTTRGGARG